MNMVRTAAAALVGMLVLVASTTAGDRGAICQVRHQAVVQAVHQVQLVPAPLYQYQVGGQLREQAIADRVADLVLQKLAASGQPIPSGQAQAQGHPTPAPQPQPQADDTLAAAQAIANDRCTSCHRHNGSDPKGADLRNLAALSELQGWATFRHVYLGTMPKNGQPLTDAQVEALMRWNVYRGD